MKERDFFFSINGLRWEEGGKRGAVWPLEEGRQGGIYDGDLIRSLAGDSSLHLQYPFFSFLLIRVLFFNLLVFYV